MSILIADLLDSCQRLPPLQTPAQAKSILRKIDWFILPMFLVTQTLQYLDKYDHQHVQVCVAADRPFPQDRS